ncbi:hypothetical protein PAHAL_9G494800 [Panicum hallii]|uniref:Uncharacterized protein n=1 Tax=Panicum hallii TaxID=206008 RepID=A0A2T8I577_9POAL|nr:hypothetical protein PAHAL_9G494800 [Panicum hallii]
MAHTWPEFPISALRRSLQARTLLRSPQLATPLPDARPPRRRSSFRSPNPSGRQLQEESTAAELAGQQGAPRRSAAAERQRRRGSAAGGHSGLRHRLHPSPLCAFTRSPFSAPGSAQAHGKSATELLRVTLKPAPSRAGLHDPRSAAPQRPPPFSSPSRRLTPSGRPR